MNDAEKIKEFCRKTYLYEDGNDGLDSRIIFGIDKAKQRLCKALERAVLGFEQCNEWMIPWIATHGAKLTPEIEAILPDIRKTLMGLTEDAKLGE